ncbi:Mesencephalic astrocyte-derived neurotrophic factor like [Schistosoma japonicum]|nr:Mesencephalic astrocyte-derived neurotrophic factor like [Schistosoma japonicum]
MDKFTAVSVFIIFITILNVIQGKKYDPSNCEVCIKFMGSFIQSLEPSDVDSSDNIKQAFMKKCESSVGKDNDFCYYVGGLKTSAANTVNRLVDPIKWKMPVEKVCQKLFELDSQICDLRYGKYFLLNFIFSEKLIDFKEFDFEKSKVKDLKKIMAKWGLECRGCTEKKDFISLIKSNMHKHDPEAAAYLQARGEL